METTVSGRDVILEVRRNMRRHGEALLYSTIVPARYEVYLHPQDFARLEGLVPRIVEEARRALSDELARMNRPAGLVDRVRESIGMARAPKERNDAEWSIEICPDPDEEASPGDIRVFSTFVLAGPGSYGGHETRRVFTSSRSPGGETYEVPPAARVGSDRPLATFRWEDENGPQTFQMVQPRVVIGRGGAGYWVDLKLRTASDVSRDHCRIRWDDRQKRFFIRDHSSFGTTVDGNRIPKGAATVEEGGATREAGPETEAPLPPRARIGLADVVFLDFQAETGP